MKGIGIEGFVVLLAAVIATICGVISFVRDAAVVGVGLIALALGLAVLVVA